VRPRVIENRVIIVIIIIESDQINIFPSRNNQQAYARVCVIQTVFPCLSVALYPIRFKETRVVAELTICCVPAALLKSGTYAWIKV
jgi:hypothetical protein